MPHPRAVLHDSTGQTMAEGDALVNARNER
jgi:hypothetical protein